MVVKVIFTVNQNFPNCVNLMLENKKNQPFPAFSCKSTAGRFSITISAVAFPCERLPGDPKPVCDEAE
jgi:hypothetical protein